MHQVTSCKTSLRSYPKLEASPIVLLTPFEILVSFMMLNWQWLLTSSFCTSLNFQLLNISRIRQFLDHETCHLIVRALILSRMDYGNWLLLGFNYNDIQRLQSIQNWSVKFIYRAKKIDHASSYLQELHWLPVRERIIFKIMMYVYKCLSGTAPSYLTACLSLYRPARTNLRSASDITRLTEHNFRKLLQSAVKRSFTHKAPQIWNALPTNIRECDSLSSFKKVS